MYRRAVFVAALLASAAAAHADVHADLFVGVSKPLGKRHTFGPEYGARLGYRTSRLGVDLSFDRCDLMTGVADAPSEKRTRLMAAVLLPIREGTSTVVSFRAAAGLKLAEARSYNFITGENYYYWHVGPAFEAGLQLEAGRGWARFLVEAATHLVADKFAYEEAYRPTVSADLRVGVRAAF